MDIHKALHYMRELQTKEPENKEIENILICLVWVVRYDNPYLGRTTDDDNGVW